MKKQVAFTAPHHAASRCGLEVLKKGGSAVDAMIAAAAMIAVHYPHMNSLGGDGFWLIQRAGEEPVAIDACGSSAALADINFYKDQGNSSVPERGGLAALTMAGTVSGWDLARKYISESQALLPLQELFGPAILDCESGIQQTDSFRAAVKKCEPDFSEHDMYSEYRSLYLRSERSDSISNPGLARLFRALAEQGLDAFYRGEIAQKLASSLMTMGSPIRLSDFNQYSAQFVEPLTVKISKAKLFNLPAPSQGLSSLLILAIFDRLYDSSWTEAEWVHALVESTKRAFLVRDREVVDPSRLSIRWPNLLSDEFIEELVRDIDLSEAMPWPRPSEVGDTVWMGALDQDGTMVSFIQSIYWEFGSGCVIPDYGLVWNNRGSSFKLDPKHPNHLAPKSKPFHTLNPALAKMHDGSRWVYGTMGGEGQPQTQAAMFVRAAYKGFSLSEAIAEPRWLLGRTWGENSHDLKIEEGLYRSCKENLLKKGHEIAMVSGVNELLGHAGAISLTPNGGVTAATDIRSDGAALVSELN